MARVYRNKPTPIASKLTRSWAAAAGADWTPPLNATPARGTPLGVAPLATRASLVPVITSCNTRFPPPSGAVEPAPSRSRSALPPPFSRNGTSPSCHPEAAEAARSFPDQHPVPDRDRGAPDCERLLSPPPKEMEPGSPIRIHPCVASSGPTPSGSGLSGRRHVKSFFVKRLVCTLGVGVEIFRARGGTRVSQERAVPLDVRGGETSRIV